MEEILVQISVTSLDMARIGETCTLGEVKAVIKKLGCDPTKVEVVDADYGIFLAPLPIAWIEELELRDYLEKQFGGVTIWAEMP